MKFMLVTLEKDMRFVVLVVLVLPMTTVIMTNFVNSDGNVVGVHHQSARRQV